MGIQIRTSVLICICIGNKILVGIKIGQISVKVRTAMSKIRWIQLFVIVCKDLRHIGLLSGECAGAPQAPRHTDRQKGSRRQNGSHKGTLMGNHIRSNRCPSSPSILLFLSPLTISDKRTRTSNLKLA